MKGSSHPQNASYGFEKNIKFGPATDPNIPKTWIVGPPLEDERHVWELECDGFIGLYSPRESDDV